MKAAVLTSYNHIEIRDVPVPEIGPEDILVRVAYAGICGSDQHIFRGEFHPRTKLPFVPGHEFIGVVEKTGGSVTDLKPGDRVAVDPIVWCGTCAACCHGHYPACTTLKLLGVDMDGGFAEFARARANMAYRIDDRVDNLHAALIEPYSIGFHAIHRAGVEAGDHVAVYGAGRIGQAIMQAARTVTDGMLFIVDVLPERLERALRACPDAIAIDAREADPIEVIMEKTGGDGVDRAIEAVGHAVSLPGRVHPVREAVRSIRGGGTVCVLSLGDEEVPLVMKELIWREGTLTTSRVSHGEYADAIRALAEGLLTPEAMISAVMPVERAQDAFGLLDSEPERHVKIILEI